MSKKFLLIILVSITLITLVLAQENTAAREAVKKTVQDFLGAIQGVADALQIFSGFAWGTRTLFFILLLAMIWPVMGMLFGYMSPWLSGFISIIVAALAIMSIPDAFLQAIVLQYGAMGASILAVIPFAILLLLTAILPSPILSRILWLAYIVYHFFIYIYKIAIIIQASMNAGESLWSAFLTPDLIPNIGSIVFGILVLVFIKEIRRYIRNMKASAAEEGAEDLAKEARTAKKVLKTINRSVGA